MTDATSARKFDLSSRESRLAMLAIFVTIISVIRICMTYGMLSQTFDEPAHLATGMQLLDKGEYTLETLHPPITKIAIALLPYLDGTHNHERPDVWSEGNDILHGQNSYWRTLTLARIGILPIYLLGVYLLWSWSKKLFGAEVAFLAVFLYTLTPPVLAHSGLATTDIGATTTFLASCYALWWFMQAPDSWRSMILGVVIGIAGATKFSYFLFFPPVALLLICNELFVARNAKLWKLDIRAILTQLTIATFSVAFATWACYLFSIGPLPDAQHPGVAGTGASLPAAEFFDGIRNVFLKNAGGHARFLLGRALHDHGSPWFFPVAIAVKTPISILLLIIAGVAMFYFKKDSIRSGALIPIIAALPVLLLSLPSNINIGLRHVLPMYPFLAMFAACAAYWLWNLPSREGKIGVGILLAWLVISSLSAGKDPLAYFNEVAAGNPEHYLLPSDLDWGQDEGQLADTLRARKIDFVSIRTLSAADVTRMGYPSTEWLNPATAPKSEWVAISATYLYSVEGYEWLRGYTPTIRVGNSIRLYHLTPEQLTQVRTLYPSANTTDLAKLARYVVQHPSPENYLDLSRECFKVQKYKECLAFAQEAISMSPNFSAAYINLGAAYSEMFQFDSAIVAMKRALKISPGLKVAESNLILFAEKKRQSDSTINAVEDLVRAEPTSEHYLKLGWHLNRIHKNRESIEASKMALKLDPQMPLAWNNIGAAYGELEEWDSAIAAEQEALKLQPDLKLAAENLGQFMREKARPQVADAK